MLVKTFTQLSIWLFLLTLELHLMLIQAVLKGLWCQKSVATPDHYQQCQLDFPPLTHLHFFTSLISRCFGEDTCITIPDIDAVVMVLQPSEPRITITGIERVSRPASDLRVSGGIALFQDLHIISTVTRADANAHHTGINSYTSGMVVKSTLPKVLKLTRWSSHNTKSKWNIFIST